MVSLRLPCIDVSQCSRMSVLARCASFSRRASRIPRCWEAEMRRMEAELRQKLLEVK